MFSEYSMEVLIPAIWQIDRDTSSVYEAYCVPYQQTLDMFAPILVPISEV